ncbi:hypothetical protein D5S17_23265 [Pseudonocardiaceae bacterium YIM PH 21723]|nr:hypothetical protein D5S17_23265 [Pseudonocardiaceae bacterium YIM PH 21723]
MTGKQAWDLSPQERRPGETHEQFDWWQHWRDDFRRSIPRTTARFDATKARVRRASEKHQWQARLAQWKAQNAQATRQAVAELIEASLVPFTRSFSRMAVHAATADLSRVGPVQAATAATTVLKVLIDPQYRQFVTDLNKTANDPELDVLDLVLDQLKADHPEAHDAVLTNLSRTVARATNGETTGHAM